MPNVYRHQFPEILDKTELNTVKQENKTDFYVELIIKSVTFLSLNFKQNNIFVLIFITK